MLENFPYTEQMLADCVRPYASDIWNYCLGKEGANLISITKEQLILTLLPRAEGKFTRKGLIVNKMRYKCDGYTEQFLSGGAVTVAYNPDDVSYVYIPEDNYQKFELIERRYQGKGLSEVEDLQSQQSAMVKACEQEQLQAKIDLATSIETIAGHRKSSDDVQLKGIRQNRQRARSERHRDLVKEVFGDD